MLDVDNWYVDAKYLLKISSIINILSNNQSIQTFNVQNNIPCMCKKYFASPVKVVRLQKRKFTLLVTRKKC